MKRIIGFMAIFAMLSLVSPAFANTPDGLGPWADTVEDHTQMLKKNGDPVAGDRSDPLETLGEAESTGSDYDNPVVGGSFFSLGFGGWIELGFENAIIDGEGNDFQIYEITGGSNYPDELVDIEISDDGIDWWLAAEDVQRDALIDLEGTPFECIHYVRVTDVSNPDIFGGNADGYDVDAAKALNTDGRDCMDSGLEVVKTANTEEVTPGELVTYTYVVTNTGDTDLYNVSISDLDTNDAIACTPVELINGDEVDEGVLNVGEIWTYECSVELETATTNIVTVTAEDPFEEEVSGTDEETVAVANPGCTLTQGFWKTHSMQGPASYYEAWKNIGDWDMDKEEESNEEESLVYEDENYGDSWLEIFWTPPKKGNVWYQLAHQWMAAKLNILNGANPGDVDDIMQDAYDWLVDEEGKLVKGKNAGKAKEWAQILGAYNEGEIGPGHCSDMELIDTIEVNPYNSEAAYPDPVSTNVELKDGKDYIFIASGTWSREVMGGTNYFDAQYSSKVATPEWGEHGDADNGDLRINDIGNLWGTLDAIGHTYEYAYSPSEDEYVEFYIWMNDVNKYLINEGGPLTVKVYEL